MADESDPVRNKLLWKAGIKHAQILHKLDRHMFPVDNSEPNNLMDCKNVLSGNETYKTSRIIFLLLQFCFIRKEGLLAKRQSFFFIFEASVRATHELDFQFALKETEGMKIDRAVFHMNPN